MAVTYRNATRADAAALAAFAAQSFADTFAHLYPPEDLASYLATTYGEAIQAEEIADPEIGCVLALSDGAIKGYCMWGAVDMEVVHAPDDREVYRLYVDKDAKGGGVAQALMQHALDDVRARGAGAVWLSVWEDNVRAQAFYKRYGFEHMGEHKFMVGNTADRDFIWRLILR